MVVVSVFVFQQYLVWEAEGLGQFADLTQSAEILV